MTAVLILATILVLSLFPFDNGMMTSGVKADSSEGECELSCKRRYPRDCVQFLAGKSRVKHCKTNECVKPDSGFCSEVQGHGTTVPYMACLNRKRCQFLMCRHVSKCRQLIKSNDDIPLGHKKNRLVTSFCIHRVDECHINIFKVPTRVYIDATFAKLNVLKTRVEIIASSAVTKLDVNCSGINTLCRVVLHNSAAVIQSCRKQCGQVSISKRPRDNPRYPPRELIKLLQENAKLEGFESPIIIDEAFYAEGEGHRTPDPSIDDDTFTEGSRLTDKLFNTSLSNETFPPILTNGSFPHLPNDHHSLSWIILIVREGWPIFIVVIVWTMVVLVCHKIGAVLIELYRDNVMQRQREVQSVNDEDDDNELSVYF